MFLLLREGLHFVLLRRGCTLLLLLSEGCMLLLRIHTIPAADGGAAPYSWFLTYLVHEGDFAQLHALPPWGQSTIR